MAKMAVRSDAEIRREREMRSWAEAMGTTAELLQKAVDAVGIAPRKVRSYLRGLATTTRQVPQSTPGTSPAPSSPGA